MCSHARPQWQISLDSRENSNGYIGSNLQLLVAVAGGMARNWRYGRVSFSNNSRVQFTSSLFLSLALFLSSPPPPPRGRSKVVKAVGVGYYKISGVVYQNMKGNSAIKGAMTLECSASNPCKGIRLQDIKLTYYEKSSIAYCEHVHGSSSGVVMPRSCLYFQILHVCISWSFNDINISRLIIIL